VNLREKIAYGLSSLLLLFALLYSIDWSWSDWEPWKYDVRLDIGDCFMFLAFVPGVLAVVYHLVTVRERRDQNRADVAKYYAWRDGRTAAKREHQIVTRVQQGTTGPSSAIAATLLLTAVFLFVAIVPVAYTNWPGTEYAGILYAGLGAYSSILYFMIARLYASALSSRFLMSSAIGSASAVVMGWVFASIGLGVLGVDPKSFNLATVLFLTGLFHKWAFDALRRRARKVFGQPDSEAAELPLDTIEGVDDVHADLLSEYGVTTVQHLATAEPGELCERTLLPLDRITDWIDQAILITYLKRQILAARTLGIRSALDLLLIYERAAADPGGAMSKLLDSLAEKTSMPRAAIDAIALKLRDDYSVGLLYALQEGTEYTPDLTVDPLMPIVARELSENYDFINGPATTRFQITRRPAQP
jgi:hypothetical protein